MHVYSQRLFNYYTIEVEEWMNYYVLRDKITYPSIP